MFKVCIRRNLKRIVLPDGEGDLNITSGMVSLEGKFITVDYDSRDGTYAGHGYWWYPEWLKFANNNVPYKDE